MKKLLLILISIFILENALLATGRFFVPVYINHDYYGELTSSVPELFLTIYSDEDEVVYEETFSNVEFVNGHAKLQIFDEAQDKITLQGSFQN